MSHIPMTAPAPVSNYEQKEKNPNLQLQPMGMHAAILYAIVNIGTQEGEYQGKPTLSNKIKFFFEFPEHKQLFYKDDTVAKPNSLVLEFAYMVSKSKKNNKKSKLLEMLEGIYGPIPENQYLTFDISRLLDQKFFVTVQHYLKQNGETGAKITAVSPFNPAMKDPNSIVRTNELMIYSVAQGFQCEAFAKLWYFLRQDIKNSVEGKIHASQGGWFAKLDENNNLVKDDGNSNRVAAPAQPLGKMIMTNLNGPTYEQFKQQGWTDENLISYGHARREAPPVQAAPAPAPIAAAPIAPIAPVPPVAQAQTKVLVMINNTFTYEQAIANGWTDETLVQNGHARWDVLPAATPVAPLPGTSIPAPPATPAANQSASTLFAETPAAPVTSNVAAPPVAAAPIPPAPVNSTFQQPTPYQLEEEHDDLPF